MRNVIIVAILLAGAFAGCISSGAKDTAAIGGASSNAPVQPTDIDPNSPNGVVQGTVVSEETAPIAGAQVALKDTPFAGTTDAQGQFLFKDVPPGKYVLLVGALGYESSGKAIEVQAAQITPVSIVMRAIQVANQVYSEVHHFAGFFDCALGTPAWVSMCSWPYTLTVQGLRDGMCTFGVHECLPPVANLTSFGVPADVQNNKFRFNMTIRPEIGQYVGELVWQPTSAASTRMQLTAMCGDYDPLADECHDAIRYGNGNGVVGAGHLRNVINAHDKDGFYQASAKDTKYDLTKHNEVWIMNYVGLPFGDATDPTNANQVALSQKFDLWVTIFYNGVGPDDYTIVQDG